MSRALFKATSLVGGMTLVSRILGFVRDMMLARYFGAGLVMDAFTQAFKIPNFGRRTFGEGAFSLAFVPVLSEYKATRSQEEVKLLTEDRKSTRLNSSHPSISYAVFCLKKKKTKKA